MNFAVLASGNGSNLQAVIRAVKARRIKANLVLVLSDKADAYALERARKAKIPAVFIDPKNFADRSSFDAAVVKVLKDASVDFVVLAGFMRIISRVFVEAFADKILNIHPSLLPAFKGAHAIKDAFEYGVKVTGVTVHLVDEQIDHGEVLAQIPVNILPKDTLASLETKIHKAEHQILPAVIALFSKGQLKIKKHRRAS